MRMRRLVTLLSASRGDLWKNLGDRLGGSVSGFRLAASQPGAADAGARRSRCSIEAGRCWRWRGYQPLPGPPARRSSSAPAKAPASLGVVRAPATAPGGRSGARRCGVRGMSQPRAKIGVSGSEHDVCNTASRRCWNVRRRGGPGNSGGSVRRSAGI